ncbi:glycogenin glucosyltransferase [Stygiomarasmius scandens]|uniref:Glycogenin glucosyltransferase n=1 Tax=Marasmiellus scandens TaxID=2682957 RepID=A0ABR1JQT6_9AGAR
MASPYAFVTLLTSDHYLPGALALAAALRDIHPYPAVPPEVDFQTVCLVTPESVDVSSIKLLRKAYDVVIGVELITQENDKGLQLLGRPDLNTVLTKLHVFRLTQYSKIIFLDADVLPIRPLSHLFSTPHEFSAVPDVGWPDIFNSGVLVLSPGEEKFSELQQLLKSKGSWDGGDQGLLNEWRGSNWNRLSFTYNTTPTAAYTYAPAYERFGSKISAIHFIGPNKPWKSIPYRAPFASQSSQQASSASPASALPSEPQQQAYDYNSLLDKWFNVYDKHYRAQTIIPDTEFEVRKYVSAWDEQSGTGAELLASAPAGGPLGGTGSLGLEDLRRLAVEGMSSTAFQPHNTASGEGEYKSMPLEGRVHLMRPQPPPKEPEDEKSEAVSANSSRSRPSSHTPGPNEVPPSPHLEPVSLPPSTATSVSLQQGYFEPSAPHYRHEDHHYHQESQPQHFQGDQRHYEPPASHDGHHHYQEHQPQHFEGNQGAQLSDSGEQRHQEYQSQSVHFKSEQGAQVSHIEYHHPQPQSPHHPQTQHQSPHHPQPQHQSPHHPEPQHQPPPQPTEAPRRRVEPPRPPSPPKLLWNPAIEPPPKNSPAPNAFPSDTYFPNIWDQTPSRTHDQTHQIQHEGPPTATTDSGAFFQPPPPAPIPELLLMQGHYRQVTGESDDTPNPDASKVKAVFPWEDKPRHRPGRVFPVSDAPPPTFFAEPVEEAPILVPEPEPEPVSPPPPRAQVPAPIFGLPNNLAFANAWDNVPSIQRYASRLVKPPQPPPQSMPSFEPSEYRRSRRKSWDERAEMSSRDGDDEDNTDDDDEPVVSGIRYVEDSDNETTGTTASRTPTSRSRRSSVSASYTFKSKKKEYRVRGVQTTPREMRSQGIQVSIDLPKVPRPSLGSTQQDSSPTRSPTRSRRTSLTLQAAGGNSKRWAPSMTSGTLPPIVSTGASIQGEPNGKRSPQTPTQQNIRSPLVQPLPKIVGATTRASVESPGMVRQASDSSSSASLPSSTGPVSPSEGPVVLPQTRKPSRVFDPARGVDVFKRGSEEVLARFLRMGSWEDESPQR